ncbi:PAS/PAC sensor signal transduction histidine kinase [Scopulibacillus darangshiensis]|uniref:histidine kinase n=1 Tax=Scopulibacillus darangshiensis TaxID=442528 RepID=A0A4V2SLH6_9BACL|nr:cell wall metabolism sensor histidine kinase WalK [Scopulibacillus darangshiensis]TCP23436.1 PAS/PAC sensor signal transduction histidine kinase [Scopulibacillus darangshiensis]
MKKVGFFKSIQVKFVLVYTLLILLAMQIIGVNFTDRVMENSLDTFNATLKQQANMLAINVGEAIKEAKETTQGDPNDITAKVNDQLSNIEGGLKEVEVIDDTGIIVATTDREHQDIVGKRTTDEKIMHDVLNSTNTNHQYKQRDEKTGERFGAITTPIMVDNQSYGILYVAKSMEGIYKDLRENNGILASATVIALLVTALLGMFLARTFTKPLAQMQKQALAISQGNFTRKVKRYDEDEIGQLAMSFNNMTERLHEANATTEAERRKLRSVLTYMTDGVIATDKNGHVILMNNRSEELLGVYRQNVLGSFIIDLLKVKDEYSIDDLYKLDQTIILDFSNDEQKILLRANFSMIKKESGAVNGLIAVLHDVTEQEQVETERREFVANVSHELRTPLTTMRSYLEALQDGAVNDEALATKFLGVTQTETERMIRLVNDLLQLSKLDAKDYTISPQRTEFMAFFNKIIDRFDMAKKQNIHLVRKLPDARVYVYIDRDKLTQVIDNIISNALKYSPEGGSLTFQVIKQKGFLRISISDQGVGIPKENLGKIFMRFYRVDRARSRKLGGTGLGLAIAKEMIEAQGGQIWAESEWNKGTTIIFTLPLTRGGREL